jgi:hypothetical protein
LTASDNCQPSGKPPHIILLLDESSFDITAAPASGFRRAIATTFALSMARLHPSSLM